MKKSLMSALGFILIPSCIFAADSPESSRYEVSINSKLPVSTVILSEEKLSENAVCMKIKVFMDEKLLQEFKCFEYAHGSGVSFKDINFDSYKDMIVRSFDSANTGYTYWLFDPISGVFIENDEDTLWNPTFDDHNKTVTTYFSLPSSNHIKIYSFKNGKKILIKQIDAESICNNTTYKCKTREVIKRLRNGKMITISDKLLTED